MSMEIVQHLQERHIDLAQSEKVGNARVMFRFARKVAPRWSETAESIYRYVRILDDAVDESPEILPIKDLLTREEAALRKDRQPTLLQKNYLLGPLAGMLGPQEDYVRNQLLVLLSGLSLDLNLRYSQQPLTKSMLRTRNFHCLWPTLTIFVAGSTGNTPKLGSTTIDLMDTWGSYDNLTDMHEDLPVGLNLISQEDMQANRFIFSNNQPLPTNELNQFSRKRSPELISQFRRNASEILKIGLPGWLGAIAYVYFYSRQYKLLHFTPIQEGATYKVPIDAEFSVQRSR